MSEEYVPTTAQENEQGQVNTDTQQNVDNQNVDTTTNTDNQSQVQPKIPYEYNDNKGELTHEEATPLIQKGMNYDKIHGKYTELQNDPSLGFVKRMAEQYGMTPAEYIEAFSQQEKDAELAELVESNIPEQYAKEMLENRAFRKEHQTEKEERQAQDKRTAEYTEFNKRFPDVKAEDVPVEVWKKQNEGVPLMYAYADHILRAKEASDSVQAQNERAQQTTTGDVSGAGGIIEGNITREVFEANKKIPGWVDKNLDSLMKSSEKWT